MCRQKIERIERSKQDIVRQDMVMAVGIFFPILQCEREIHEMLHHMGWICAWSKDIRAASTAE